MNRSIDQLLKEGRHYDNDIKIMALNDLSNKLIDESTSLNSQIQTDICDIFLYHLDATSIDVQSKREKAKDPLNYKEENFLLHWKDNKGVKEGEGNAIRCIGNCIERIQEAHLINLLEKLIKHLLQGNNQTKQIRDIYATCIKTIINKVPEKFAEIICKSILKNCFDGLQMINDTALEEEIIEIISIILKNFQPYLQTFNNPFLKTEFPKYLLKKITIKQDTLRKKACTCLGLLSPLLSTSLLSDLSLLLISILTSIFSPPSSHPPPIPPPSSLFPRPSPSLIAPSSLLLPPSSLLPPTSSYLLHLQFLASIVKNAPIKVNRGVILPFIMGEIKRIEGKEEEWEVVNEILESQLNILEVFARGEGNGGEILEVARRFLGHDPNNVVNVENDIEIEDEDEYEDSYDYATDDSSWRVRRAAIHIISTLLKYRKDLVNEISSSCVLDLVKRLREKDENIRLDTFNALSDFFKAIVHDTEIKSETEEISLVRMRSNLIDTSEIISQLIEQLFSILKTNNSPSIKGKSSSLLLTASLCVPELALKKERFEDFLNCLENSIEGGASLNETKVNLLLCLRTLMKGGFESNFNFAPCLDRIYDLALKACKISFYKIASEGFRVLSAAMKAGGGERTWDTIINKMEEGDIDQEVKNALIHCCVNLILFSSSLSSSQLSSLLSSLLKKLKNEMTRLSVLKNLQKLSPSRFSAKLKENLDNPTIIKKISEILFELTSFLHKQSRNLKILSLENIVILLEAIKGKVEAKEVKEILSGIGGCLKDDDFHLAELGLEVAGRLMKEEKAKEQEKLFLPIIESCIKLSHSPLIQGTLLEKLSQSFKMMTNQNLIDFNWSLQKLMGGGEKGGVAKCVAGMIEGGGEGRRKGFVDNCLQNILNKSESGDDLQNKQLALLIIREIGKTFDFSQNEVLFNAILENLNHKNESVKNSASLALGGISLGNQEYFIPKVVRMIEQADAREFLILNTLKEIIHDSKEISTHIVNLVPFLFKYAENKDESIKNFAAECVGKICFSRFEDLLPFLLSSITSSSSYIVLASLRHFINKSFSSSLLHPLLPSIYQIFQTQKDILLRKAVLNAFCTIAFNAPKLVKDLPAWFSDVIKEDLKIRSELIREVELGPFKHKVDDGLGLRISAYSFVEIAAEINLTSLHPSVFVDAIMKGLDEIHDEIFAITLRLLQKLSFSSSILLSSLSSLFPPSTLSSSLLPTPLQEDVLKKFRTKLDKLKKGLNIKAESDRSRDCIRSLVRTCLSLGKGEEGEGSWKGFLEEMGKDIVVEEIIKSVVQG